jgi:hypothetical protein
MKRPGGLGSLGPSGEASGNIGSSDADICITFRLARNRSRAFAVRLW